MAAADAWRAAAADILACEDLWTQFAATTATIHPQSVVLQQKLLQQGTSPQVVQHVRHEAVAAQAVSGKAVARPSDQSTMGSPAAAAAAAAAAA